MKRWQGFALVLLAVIGSGLACFFSFQLKNKDQVVADIVRKLEQAMTEKKGLEEEVARYKSYQKLDELDYFVTSTFRDVQTVVVNGRPWQFIHTCEGRPALGDDQIRCEWGNSTLSVIDPQGDETVLVKMLGAGKDQIPGTTKQSYLGMLKLLERPNDSLLLIEFGNYQDLAGQNEMGGGDTFYNYVFRFKDQTLGKIANYPDFTFSQEPTWNSRLSMMAFVPAFCHPGCVPVPLAVYDLQRDEILVYSKVSAYGSKTDLEYAISPEDYKETYWEKIEWVDVHTIRAFIIDDQGKRTTITWDVEKPDQSKPFHF